MRALHHPRCLVDRRAEVVPVALLGTPEMEPDPDRKARSRTPAGLAEGPLDRLSAFSGIIRLRERCRERVAGGREHCTVAALDRVGHEAVVEAQGVRHRLGVLRPETGGADDVCEEERDLAGWELGGRCLHRVSSADRSEVARDTVRRRPESRASHSVRRAARADRRRVAQEGRGIFERSGVGERSGRDRCPVGIRRAGRRSLQREHLDTLPHRSTTRRAHRPWAAPRTSRRRSTPACHSMPQGTQTSRCQWYHSGTA